jgi:hypothetical protein
MTAMATRLFGILMRVFPQQTRSICCFLASICLIWCGIQVGCDQLPPTPSAPIAVPAPRNLERIEDGKVPEHYQYLFTLLSEEEYAAAQAGIPYSKIQFERTVCYGECPAYVVTLAADGSAEYVGNAHVSRLGMHKGEVGFGTYGRLCWAIEKFKLLEGPKDYSAPWTDDSSSIIRVTERKTGETITISDYGRHGPVELWTVFEAIDSAASKIDWKQEAR